jgi:hypothetical protein
MSFQDIEALVPSEGRINCWKYRIVLQFEENSLGRSLLYNISRFNTNEHCYVSEHSQELTTAIFLSRCLLRKIAEVDICRSLSSLRFCLVGEVEKFVLGAWCSQHVTYRQQLGKLPQPM